MFTLTVNSDLETSSLSTSLTDDNSNSNNQENNNNKHNDLLDEWTVINTAQVKKNLQVLSVSDVLIVVAGNSHSNTHIFLCSSLNRIQKLII